MALTLAILGTGYIAGYHATAAIKVLGIRLEAVVDPDLEKVDDTGVVIVNWNNGVTSYIESGWWQLQVDGPAASTQLYGTKGFGSVFPTRLIRSGDRLEERNIQESGFAFLRQDHTHQAMYDRQLLHFVECIRNQRAPLASGLVGWTNMRIVDAAYQSSQTGEVVTL